MPTGANPIMQVGGSRYFSFTRLTVQWGAKQSVRAFATTVTSSVGSPFQEAWEFMPGTDVVIMEGGDLIFTGYVQRMSPSFDSKDHKVEISGRSKSADHVDSHSDHPTGEIRKKKTADIGNELDLTGVKYTCDESDATEHELFRVNPYETIFQSVERLCRKEQLLQIGQADGSVKLAKGGKEQVNAPLMEGKNIISGNAVFDDGDKSSEYKIRGQRALGTNRKAIQITAKSEDSSVKRKKVKHLHHEGDADSKAAQKRADHTRDRQQGESTSASVRVVGWRDDNGVMWKENTLVYVYSPTLKLDMQMLIDTIELTLEASGSFTQLGLVHPKALGSDTSSGSKTDDVWQPGF